MFHKLPIKKKRSLQNISNMLVGNGKIPSGSLVPPHYGSVIEITTSEVKSADKRKGPLSGRGGMSKKVDGSC